VKVIYTGPHPEVTVPELGLVAERDKPVVVKAEVGERLAAQADWSAETRNTEGASAPDKPTEPAEGDAATEPTEPEGEAADDTTNDDDKGSK
jgi:hypothetical protein